MTLKQKYELISKYINNKNDNKENEEIKKEEEMGKKMNIPNISSPKVQNNTFLTLRVISSNSDLFRKGLEINIDPQGLDENYPFAMRPEEASQFYNLRKESDG